MTQSTTMMTNNTTMMTNNTTMMTHNMTTAPINMTAAPTITNTTVGALEEPLNRTGCGTRQLCGSEPSDCDPSSSSSSCFFLGAKQKDGNNFEFALSGESSGYIATTLSFDSTAGNNDTTYVCANSNGKVSFISALLNNNVLQNTTLPVNSVKGRVNGNKIQCTFIATLQTITTRAVGATVSISNGSFNPANGDLGDPQNQFQSKVPNLGNVSSVLTNELSSTTSSPTTTDHAITFQQSLMQVLLISMGVFTLAMV
nr:PREDICTED: putative ferric-chelate reductase 1 [Paralichthys olivaceus]